ncbi:DUF998 domain-containing protein [Candidatus Enterococcus leclercqii]|uniref:DUF998 domain-containing protein n=1 Tax=Candidatus Enterococcus leclercqii TaxID=1857218 RepID=UPI001F3F9BDD|nr:DUF998 domain-containing protein [Enterococcus sp. CU9D]KAF1293861.1 hypothetical protein BAU14_11445 [Enterococcus sp. CU9D]
MKPKKTDKIILLGSVSLLLFVIGDWGLPYVLGPIVTGYDPLRQVVSDLGSVGSPVKTIFERGSIVTGSLLLLSLPGVWQLTSGDNRRKRQLLLVGLALFAVGDCIFTGVFKTNHSTSGLTLGTIIHGGASGAGIVGMLAVPLILSAMAKDRQNHRGQQIYLLLFAACLLTSLFNGISQGLHFTYKGLWQRISLVLLYAAPLLLGSSGLYFVSKKDSLQKKGESMTEED